MATSYTRKARTIRLPVVTDSQLNAFDTGLVQSRGSYIYNGTVLQYPDGTPYVTQRPAFTVFNSPSDSNVTDVRGRGIYYWAGHGVDDLYFINNQTLYKGSYSNPIFTSFSDSAEKIEIAELAGDLVFVDKHGQKMYYIDAAVDDSVVNEMVDASTWEALPQNNGKTLAHGVAVLDQTMYVLAEEGTVWGSAIADVTDWDDALNVITAEKEDDSGVYITKHYDHVTVLGRRTIEFMYDAGNPTGSPLGVREDISHNIGCADPHSIWRNGDDLYFLGIDSSGQIQPYLMREFRLEPIGNPSGVSFLTTSKSVNGIQTFGAGLSSGGTTYYILTIYNEDSNGNLDTSASFVYNTTTQIWTEWEYAGNTIDNFPLVSYTVTDDSRIGEGILSSGELVFVNDQFIPYDTTKDAVADYMVTDYVVTGYVASGGVAETEPMTMKVRLDNFDNDNRDWKFAHQLRFVGDETANANDLTVRWNDGNNIAPQDQYTGNRTIDLSSNLNKLTRLGRFKSRSFEFEYAGTDQIRFEGVDLDVTDGSH